VAWNEGKAKAKAMIIMMKQSERWLMGASFSSGFRPVQNPFGHNPLAPDLKPDHRSGSSLSLNLGPDHGQVRLGSGSNHGSELNLTIPNLAHAVYDTINIYGLKGRVSLQFVPGFCTLTFTIHRLLPLIWTMPRTMTLWSNT
jgi:hypothetical protein